MSTTPYRAGESGRVQSLTAGILALHRPHSVDTCCSPEQFTKTCQVEERCHECHDLWPCATARIVKRFGGNDD